MVEVEWVIKAMEKIAPPEKALAWDNGGLQVGDPSLLVVRALTALDCTDEVIDLAIEMSAQMIITHHPLIFSPIKSITTETPFGLRLIKLINRHISVYSAHTALDLAVGGTNDLLAAYLDLVKTAPLMDYDSDEPGLGRVGYLRKPCSLGDFASFVGEKLQADVRICGNPDARLKKAALCSGGGSGLKYFKAAKAKGADVYITGDIKFHDAQQALEMGLCLVDATHSATEAIYAPHLADLLNAEAKKERKEVEFSFSGKSGQVFSSVWKKSREEKFDELEF
jgi:dinuclear metal center YbgI/SA1388 family protein